VCYVIQLSGQSAGPSTLDTSHRGAEVGREDRHRRDTAATGRGQAGVNYRVIESTRQSINHSISIFL